MCDAVFKYDLERSFNPKFLWQCTELMHQPFIFTELPWLMSEDGICGLMLDIHLCFKAVYNFAELSFSAQETLWTGIDRAIAGH